MDQAEAQEAEADEAEVGVLDDDSAPWEQPTAQFYAPMEVVFGLQRKLVRSFVRSDVRGTAPMFCIEDLALACGHSQTQVTKLKSRLGKKLYRGAGLPLSGEVLCAARSDLGHRFWLDVATADVAAEVFRRSISGRRRSAFKAGTLAVVADLEARILKVRPCTTAVCT